MTRHPVVRKGLRPAARQLPRRRLQAPEFANWRSETGRRPEGGVCESGSMEPLRTESFAGSSSVSNVNKQDPHLLRPPQPGVLPCNRDVLVVAAIPYVGAIAVAELQSLMLGYWDG